VRDYLLLAGAYLLSFLRPRGRQARLWLHTLVCAGLLLLFMRGNDIIRYSLRNILSPRLALFNLSQIILLLIFLVVLYARKGYLVLWSKVMLSFLSGLAATRLVYEVYVFFDGLTLLSFHFMTHILSMRYSLAYSQWAGYGSILLFALFIGLVEETAKLLLFSLIIYPLMEQDGLFAFIFLLAVLAVGFSLLENVIYSVEFGDVTRVMRNLFPGHLVLSVVMALFLFRAHNALGLGRRLGQYLLGLASVIVLHAVWNFLHFASIYHAGMKILFYLFYLLLLAICALILRKALR